MCGITHVLLRLDLTPYHIDEETDSEMSSTTAKVIHHLNLSRSDFNTCASATVLCEPRTELCSAISAVCSVNKSYPTLCCSMDHSQPGSSVYGISQAKILEWVAISFSRGIFLTQIEPASSALQMDSLPLSHQESSFCSLHQAILMFSLTFSFFPRPCDVHSLCCSH